MKKFTIAILSLILLLSSMAFIGCGGGDDGAGVGHEHSYEKLKYDAQNYSKAYKQYRKIWIEENIVWLVIAIVLLFAIPLTIGRIKRIKWEIDMADIFKN